MEEPGLLPLTRIFKPIKLFVSLKIRESSLKNKYEKTSFLPLHLGILICSQLEWQKKIPRGLNPQGQAGKRR